MPFSHSGQITAIVRFAERLQPKSVLDVGTGMGQYGFLLRTNLEHLHLFEIDGSLGRQRPREQWRIRIDGIEGFVGYRTPVHDYAYTQMFFGDALQILRAMPAASYELVMAIDILEHFDTPDGEAFARECQRVSSRVALLSTPKDFVEQHVEANPLEDHRSVWTQEQLAALGYSHCTADAESWIVSTQPV